MEANLHANEMNVFLHKALNFDSVFGTVGHSTFKIFQSLLIFWFVNAENATSYFFF